MSKSKLRKFISSGFALTALAANAETKDDPSSPAMGPLKVLQSNPRYFTDGSGKAVYLTGSHVWNNLSDVKGPDSAPDFDFEAYLAFQEKHAHNFIRLWRLEEFYRDPRDLAKWTDTPSSRTIAPHPWARTGPGEATDGKPKFNLEVLDPAYFKRLRARVEAAGQRGIYVSVMLFEGWALQHFEHSWVSHPFQRDNNVNGIAGDANGDAAGLETHSLELPAVVRLQEAYVRKVIDTVGDLDNVLFEIVNEAGNYSTRWQYHMIRFIKAYEKTKPKQHPVGMTFQQSDFNARRGTNKALFKSPADWISPSFEAPGDHDYRSNPPVARGRKVILSDTDHLWGIGGDPAWAWKSFLRGHNPIFMDPIDGRVLGKGDPGQWEPIRRAMGQTRRVAARIDLACMTPRPRLASTTYCLADPGATYLVYQPNAGEFTVNLGRAKGGFSAEWIETENGTTVKGEKVRGPGILSFTPPREGPILLLLESP